MPEYLAETQTAFENAYTILLTVLVVPTVASRPVHRERRIADISTESGLAAVRLQRLDGSSAALSDNEAVGNHFLIAFVVEQRFYGLSDRSASR